MGSIRRNASWKNCKGVNSYMNKPTVHEENYGKKYVDKIFTPSKKKKDKKK